MSFQVQGREKPCNSDLACSHPFGDLTPIPVSGPFTSCPLYLPSPQRSEAISCSLPGEVPRDATHRHTLGWLWNWRVRPLRSSPIFWIDLLGLRSRYLKLVGLRANVNPCDAGIQGLSTIAGGLIFPLMESLSNHVSGRSMRPSRPAHFLRRAQAERGREDHPLIVLIGTACEARVTSSLRGSLCAA